MKHKPGSLVLLVLGLAAGLLARAQELPPISVVPVAGPVFMLASGGNGNVGVVADPAGVFMIDAMEEEMAGKLRAALESLPGGERVRVLVNTHWHWDHVNGNKAFGPAAVIVAHENTRALNAADQPRFGDTIKALPSGALPVLTYSDRMAAHAGGLDLRLVHYPHAHTGGDTVVFIDALKIVHTGDMFFNGMFPYLDVPSGGDVDQLGPPAGCDPRRPARRRQDHPRPRPPGREGRAQGLPGHARRFRGARPRADEARDEPGGDPGRRDAGPVRALDQGLHARSGVARTRLPEPRKERAGPDPSMLAAAVVDALGERAVDLDVEIGDQVGQVLLVFGHVADEIGSPSWTSAGSRTRRPRRGAR